jgi:hypothetical protein
MHVVIDCSKWVITYCVNKEIMHIVIVRYIMLCYLDEL